MTELRSRLTCPHCGHVSEDVMPTGACAFFHDRACRGAVLGPRPGDCCVFRSCGSVPCPPIRQGGSCDPRDRFPPSCRPAIVLQPVR